MQASESVFVDAHRKRGGKKGGGEKLSLDGGGVNEGIQSAYRSDAVESHIVYCQRMHSYFA